MKNLIFTFSLLSLSVGASTERISKEACSDLDLRNTHPKISKSKELREHFSTPRNQDSVGWCHAFSASDLLSAHVGVPVSSLHTSAIYNNWLYLSPQHRREAEKTLKSGQRRFEEIYQSGGSDLALFIVAQNKWVCSEKGLPFDKDKPNRVYELIKSIEELKAKTDKLKWNSRLVCEELSQGITPYKLLEKDLQRISSYMIGSNLNIALKDFADSACTEKIKVPPLKTSTINKFDKDKRPQKNYLNHLNNLISKNTLVQFTYNIKDITFASGIHSSVIMGRRWKNNRCEFNIRNSWGKSCGAFNDKVECNREEGSFWMSDEDFHNVSFAYNHIK